MYRGCIHRERYEKGNPVARRVSTQSYGPLVRGGSQAAEQWRVMEDNNRLNQDGEVVLALEALGTLEVLEDMVDALDAKVDSLDRRIGKAEARLEEIVAEQH
jgi:hypothetical protein